MQNLQQLSLSLTHLVENASNLDNDLLIIKQNVIHVPLRIQKNILDVITIFIHRMTQQQGYNEYYTEQSIQILLLIKSSVFEDNIQNSILIMSSLTQLINVVDIITITNLQLLQIKLIQIKTLLSCSIPQLTSTTIGTLLINNKSTIQENSLNILLTIITYLSEQQFKLKSFNLTTLNYEIGDIVSDKINEYLVNLCKLIKHSPTPKLARLYTQFITYIFRLSRINNLLQQNTINNLIDLYFRYYDGSEICLPNQKIDYLQQQLVIFNKLKTQIDSATIIQQIRKLKWILSVQLINTKIRSIYKCLKHSITFNVDNKIQSIQIMEHELLPICNNDPLVLRELKSLLQSINCKELSEMFYDKIIIMLQQFNEKIIVYENKVIQFQISELLQLTSYLFIFNHFPLLNQNNFRRDLTLIYNLILDHNTNYVILLQSQFLKFAYKLYQKGEKQDKFRNTQFLDYLVCIDSSENLKVFSEPILREMAQSLQNNSVKEMIQQYSGSLIYRNISKLEDHSLEIDKGHALKTIIHILELDCFQYDFTFQVLNASFKLFDKYYLKSEEQFVLQYLGFINNFVKKWQIDQPLDNQVITILRQIMLQISTFLTIKTFQLLTLQCFYHAIPKLAQQQIKNSQPTDLFGMNDGSNVIVPDTFGVIFFDCRKAFEDILSNGNIIAVDYVWKIVLEMYQHNKEMAFFKGKSITEFISKDQVQKSVYFQQFFQQYFK